MVAALLLAIWLIHRQIHGLRLGDVRAALQAMPAPRVLTALALSVASYLLLAAYDGLALRYLRRRVAAVRVLLTSFLAYAFGHNLGVSALTGTAVRMRLYADSGVSAVDAATISGFCSVTSALGLATLGGTSLLLAPGQIGPLHGHVGLALVIGVGSWMMIALYLGWSGSRRVLEVRGWTLRAPGAPMAVMQWLLGTADMTLAASVLWVLLPPGVISFPSFAGAYAAAVVVGIVSHLPGGVGVFEAVLVLALPQLGTHTLLGALLTYRALYYLAPLAVATLLFVAREVLAQRSRWIRAHTMAAALIAPFSPWVGALLAFIAGSVLLLSGATPAIDQRLRILREVLPLPVLELSHLVASSVGLGLLILARGLSQRTHAAYQVTLLLLGAGILTSLLKGLDFEEAAVLGGVALILWTGRAGFYRPAALLADRFTPPWIASVTAVLLVVLWVAILAQRHLTYSTEWWWTFAFSGDAPRALRAALLTSMLAAAAIGFSLLRPRAPEPVLPGEADLQRAAAILTTDPQSHGNVALYGDKRLLFHPRNDAFLMYQLRGRSWVALGDPVGAAASHEDLIWSFRELADQHGGRTVFYEVSGASVHRYVDLGLSALKLGEEARVALEDFTLDGAARADLRQAHRRAQRDGASFEVVPAKGVDALLPRLQRISDAWLADKATAEKGFSVGAFRADYLRRFPLALVRMEGDPVAFANVWCSADHEELSVDLMRFGPDAPRGAMDYLFIELMLWGRGEQFRWFNLGMAPLAGLESHPLAPVWHRVGNFLFEHGEHFYNFEGLRRYKAKFEPQWQPRYLMAPGGLALPRVLLDVSLLISGGARALWSK
jgi:phosphatidylglycerol lysyltransferase